MASSLSMVAFVRRHSFVFPLLFLACSEPAPVSTPAPAGCVPGASAACTCTDGRSGAQVCRADRTFDACVCAGGSLDAAPDRVEAADAPPDVSERDVAATDAGTDLSPPDVAPDQQTSDAASPDTSPLDVAAPDASPPDVSPPDVAPDASPSGNVTVAIGARGGHTCVLYPDGTVRCAGLNTSGQLGNGATANFSRPVAVLGLSGVTQLSLGENFSCALLRDGTVRCWGGNEQGQLGNGGRDNIAVPVAVTGLSNVVQITAGGAHACALLNDGTVRCWGGIASPPPTMPVAVSGLRDVAEVRAGGVGATARYICARSGDGSVRCWGDNRAGQLGTGMTSNLASPGTPVVDLSDATALSLGVSTSCALTRSRGIVCWGANESGQFGDGTTTQRATPVATAVAVVDPTHLAVGYRHTCAIRADRSVWCRGRTARPARVEW